MSEGLGLSYWLAQTQFTVTVAKRNLLEPGRLGNYARPVVDVQIAPAAVVDPSGRQSLTIEAALLDKLSLTISLDDRGFIESINTDATPPTSPGVTTAEETSVAAAVAVTCEIPVAATVEPRPLEEQWVRQNERLAFHATELETNIGRLLHDLGHRDANPVSITQSGEALEFLQSQLAAISQVKRSWLVNQTREHERAEWRLSTTDLVWVDADQLPPRVEDTNIPTPLVEMTDRFGVLVVIADGERPETDLPIGHDLENTLVLRRSRSAQIGVYVRGTDGEWHLEDDSVLVMDIVDAFSETDLVSLDGSWLRSKSFNLAYHPDMSLRTFGLTASARSKTPPGNSIGVERGTTTKPRRQPRKPVDQPQETTAAQLQLLNSSSDYEVLAATRAQTSETTLVEQRGRIQETSEGT